MPPVLLRPFLLPPTPPSGSSAPPVLLADTLLPPVGCGMSPLSAQAKRQTWAAPRPGWASAPFARKWGETAGGPGSRGALGAHLDGERDVRVGTEAPAPVAGAVVEAAACTGTDVGVRPGHPLTCHVPPTPGSVPRKALGLQVGRVNRAPGHVTIPCHHGHPWGCPHGCSHH